MTKRFLLGAFVFFIFCCQKPAPKTDLLKQQIQKIVAKKNAIVGVSIIGNNGSDTISINGDKHFPMQSVFKLHIALAVLSEIDKGKFSLHQNIKIKKEVLMTNLYSPIRDKYPNGATLPLSEIIEYTVAASDNVGCDVLLKLIGGPKTVEDYLKKCNINDVAIKFNEEHQQAEWELQFQNWTTPKATSSMLEKFYYNKNKLLSKKTYNFLWETMKGTETGKNRLKGQLPKGTTVAHKTGTSGANDKGISAATNDIGIVFLPNGKHFFISVFVANSKESEQTNEKIIADIAKATWDYYLAKRN